MPSFVIGARRRRAVSALSLAAAVLATAVFSVLPAPTAAAATTLATDGFDRTTGSGWGTAPTGGAWSVTGGSGRSTGSSTAVVSGVGGGNTFRAQLPSVKAADVSVRAAFVVTSATQMYYSTEARRQSNGTSYAGRARIDGLRRLHVEAVRMSGGGTATVLAAKMLGTVAAGRAVTVELDVSGSSTVTLKAKSYLTGTTVPDWQVKASDTSGAKLTSAGTVGMSGFVTAGQATQTFRIQAFSASGSAASSSSGGGTTTTPVVSTASSSGYGSLPVGSASYGLPSGAVVAAPWGNDGASGTVAAPVKTLTRAIAKVKGGGTVVLRGGTYHEYAIVPPGKNITIQNYPSEAVWFDGAKTVTGFAASGSGFKVDGWTNLFDASPTYTKGAADSAAVGYTFLNPAYPMAAHPDQVWINGAEQTQVGSLGALRAGTFFVDTAAKRLWLGTNPSGKTVEASTLSQALSLRAPGTTVRGIGFRRYANSVWQQGVITSYQPNMRLENIVVADAATAGIGLYASGCTVKDVTITGSGQMGLQASYADNLTVDGVLIRNSNDQNFNPTPSAGGFKVTTTRGVVFKNSMVTGTIGNQVWFDQSVYNMDVLNNTVTGGSRWGVVVEISSSATIANNVVANNAHDGILVANSDKVNIWNNTVVGNQRAAVAVTQDKRRVTQLNVAGHDKRRAQPDLSMPWISREITMANNILTGGTADKSSVLHVESWERVFTGESMLVWSEGNVFSQSGGAKYASVWGNQNAYATNYASLAAYVAGSGRDGSSRAYAGHPVGSSLTAVSGVSALNGIAQPLPGWVAGKISRTTGEKRVGAFH